MKNLLRNRVGQLTGLAFLAILLGVTIGFVTLTAQGSPGQISGSPLDLIVMKLDQIIAMLTPAAGPVTLSTPSAVVLPDETVLCAITNVSTEAVHVDSSHVVNGAGVVISSGNPFDLAPGHSSAGGGSSSTAGAFRWCEFKLEGTAASVRANLVIQTATGSTRLSVDAR